MEFCYSTVEVQTTLIMIHCERTMNHRRVTDCEELKKIHTFSKWFWRWYTMWCTPWYMLKFHTYAYIHSDTTHKYYLPWTKFKWLQKLSAYVICLFMCSYRSIFHIRYSHVIILQLSMGVFTVWINDIYAISMIIAYSHISFDRKTFSFGCIKKTRQHMDFQEKKRFNKMTLLMTCYSSSSVKAFSMILYVCV